MALNSFTFITYALLLPLLQDKLISSSEIWQQKIRICWNPNWKLWMSNILYIKRNSSNSYEVIMFCLCLVMSWTCAFSPACCCYLCQTFHLTDRVWQKRPQTSSVTSRSSEVTSWAILWTQPLQALPAGRALKPEALDDQGVVFVFSGDPRVLLNLSTTTGTLDPTTHRKNKYHK